MIHNNSISISDDNKCHSSDTINHINNLEGRWPKICQLLYISYANLHDLFFNNSENKLCDIPEGIGLCIIIVKMRVSLKRDRVVTIGHLLTIGGPQYTILLSNNRVQ